MHSEKGSSRGGCLPITDGKLWRPSLNYCGPFARFVPSCLKLHRTGRKGSLLGYEFLGLL